MDNLLCMFIDIILFLIIINIYIFIGVENPQTFNYHQ